MGAMDSFWDCAAECNAQTKAWIANGWGRESLLLFSSGWEFMNMNRVVELNVGHGPKSIASKPIDILFGEVTRMSIEIIISIPIREW